MTLDRVLAEGFTHGFGAAPANRDLLLWAELIVVAIVPQLFGPDYLAHPRQLAAAAW